MRLSAKLSAISVIIFIQPKREQNDDKSQNLCMLCCQFSVPHQRLQLDNTCQQSAFKDINCTINCPHLNDNAAEWSKMPKTYFTYIERLLQSHNRSVCTKLKMATY